MNFTNLIEPLYMAYSERSPKVVRCAEEVWPMVQAFCQKSGEALPELKPPAGIPFEQPVVRLTENKKEVLVGFSGGKDGVAVALLLKKQGINPVLFHLKGINPKFHFEMKHAKALAKQLQLPLVVNYMKAPKQSYPDNPFKNQYILSRMVDYGVQHGITRYVMGNHDFESIDGCNPLVEFSDTQEQFKFYDGVIKNQFQSYQRQTLLKTNRHALEVVGEERPELITVLSSCISLAYRKPGMIKNIEKRFGKVLMAGRCGYCYKCVSEYLILTELGILTPNKKYVEWCKEKKDPDY